MIRTAAAFLVAAALLAFPPQQAALAHPSTFGLREKDAEPRPIPVVPDVGHPRAPGWWRPARRHDQATRRTSVAARRARDCRRRSASSRRRARR